ncbi:hypothetical protein LT493_08955 [Streptomyces tricolor]|nr:hypothetical protein [Streptomyces tricolor]
MVEIPPEWIRDDAAYLNMDRYSAVRPYTPPRELIPLWRDEFDAARAGGRPVPADDAPVVIGHRSRIVVLAELLDYIGRPRRRLVRDPRPGGAVRLAEATGNGTPG